MGIDPNEPAVISSMKRIDRQGVSVVLSTWFYRKKPAGSGSQTFPQCAVAAAGVPTDMFS